MFKDLKGTAASSAFSATTDPLVTGAQKKEESFGQAADQTRIFFLETHDAIAAVGLAAPKDLAKIVRQVAEQAPNARSRTGFLEDVIAAIDKLGDRK